MYGERISTCSEIHRSHSNTLPGQDAANLNAETGTATTRSNQVPFKGYCLEVSLCTARFNTKILYFFPHLYLRVCDP